MRDAPRMKTQQQLTPAGDWIVVRQDDLITETSSGIQLIQREADWTAFGVVVSVGPGARGRKGDRVAIDDPKAGDRVVYEWRPSNEEKAMARLCGDRTILLRADEIVAVLEDEGPAVVTPR